MSSDFAPAWPQTEFAPRLCDLLNYGIDLGLRDYPIFDESYRDVLNQKIVDHFYDREIGTETPALFVMYLNRTMREQMPQINRVYEALRDRSNVLGISETIEGQTTSVSTGTSRDTSRTTSTATQYASNAPQVSMVGKNEVDYYDTGNRSMSESDGDGTSTDDRHDTGTTKTERSIDTGGLSDMLLAWYTGVNNADTLVFQALEPCFSQIFAQGYGGY